MKKRPEFSFREFLNFWVADGAATYQALVDYPREIGASLTSTPIQRFTEAT